MKENILDVLKNLNFTEYESKAYLALLEESPLTGYAVAKKSGVPRSKIYEVLESLVIRGDIFVSYGNTPQYIPVPAKDLIKNRRMKAEETFEQAEKYFEKFERTANDRENIWNIMAANVKQDNYVDYFLDVKEAGTYVITYTLNTLTSDGTAYANAFEVNRGVPGSYYATNSYKQVNIPALWTGTNVLLRHSIELEEGMQTLEFKAKSG